MRYPIRIHIALTAVFFFGQALWAQQQPGQLKPSDDSTSPDTIATQKRLFGIIPNARSSPSLVNYTPLTAKQKMKIATNDSFDRGTVILAALFGGEGQLTRAEPSFGNGVEAYAKYFGTSYGDFLIGNMMTEGIYPSLLHQDPRYFRRGSGSTKSRLGAAVKQIFWTRTDSGGSQFNISEIGGNATAVAISNAYYPDQRTAGDAISKLATQLAVDMASNILKEFGPDITAKFRRHKEQH